MKHFYFTIALFSSISVSQAQGVATATLEQNNVRAHIADNGFLFNDVLNDQSGYIVPRQEGTGAMFGLNINYTAKDPNETIHFSKSLYGISVWSGGPVRDNYNVSVTPSISCISRTEISNHIHSYTSPSYTIPGSLLEWPAHGDQENGEAWLLAPFEDIDGDGIYAPQNGDFPCIKGDRACYIIMNDQKPDLQTEGLPSVGLETHIMVYQLNSASEAVNNATFMEVKTFNRSETDYTDFVLGILMDGDIGGFDDDFIGTDAESSTLYFYNGRTIDQGFMGVTGYGANPPALGLTALNEDLSYTNYPFQSNWTVMELYNLFNGRNPDGTPLEHDYVFDGYYETGRTEITTGGVPGDRRGFASYTPVNLPSGESHSSSFVISYGKSSMYEHLFSPVESLITNIYELKDAYSQISSSCDEVLSNGKPISKKEIALFPNPASDKLTIHTPSNGEFILLNALGQKVYEGKLTSPATYLSVSHLSEGMYFAKISTDTEDRTIKWIKE